MRQWLVEECPGLDWRDHTRRFVDYWRAQPGAKGTKLDWVATWRNWMRRAHDDTRRATPRGDRSQRQADAVRSLAAKFAQEGK
jgi:hypothetical protein